MGRRPIIEEVCPVCSVRFMGGTAPSPTGSTTKGKACPNGHWTSIEKLRRGGQPKRIDIEAVLAQLGTPDTPAALQMALLTMVECYERAVRSFPEAHVGRGLVAGAFGKAPEIARRILGAA